MENLAIYGTVFGKEVACMIDKINREWGPTWNLIGFFDDTKEIGDNVDHFGLILGGIDQLNEWPEPLCVALAFGYPKSVKTVREKITNPLIEFPNLIDPDFEVDDFDTFSIGEGNIIKSGCSCTTNISIGSYNILNSAISIGHDTGIGNFNCFMPGTRISGNVRIGDGNLFGAQAFVKEKIKIGDNITISPLSALLTKPKDGCLYIGNPAALFKF